MKPAGPLTRAGFPVVCVLLFTSACLSGSGDLPDIRGAADSGRGPRVMFDPLAHPNPVVPLPNDVSSVLASDSPTGRSLNIKSAAATRFERQIRAEINRLDGFGTFAPIVVPFDGEIDLETLGPDSVKLVNIDPDSPRYGEEIPLDFPDEQGRSLYPAEIAPWPFPPYSPCARERQMLFDPRFQGEVDSPGFVDFYERETNTLLLRVLRPLDQETEYMAVLTTELKGMNGDPVRSPFTKPVHSSQLQTYLRVAELLRPRGVPEARIAFAWSFTTQTTTRDLEVISDGLRGLGVLGTLPDLAPPVITQVADLETDLDRIFCSARGDNPCRDNRWILQAEMLDPFMGLLDTKGLIRAAGILFIDADLGLNARMRVSLDAIDYFVFGRFLAPGFQEPGSEMFRMDYRTGEAAVKPIEVPWMIAVPKPAPGRSAPFPVVLHGHGIPALRWQIITEANTWARHGYATVAITVPQHEPIVSVQDIHIVLDSIVHGLAACPCASLPEPERESCEQEQQAIIEDTLDLFGKPVMDLLNCVVFKKCDPLDGSFREALEVFLRSGFLAQLLVEGRAEDLDGDGNTDHGAIFTADLFRSRDRMRQYIVEQMQMLQLLQRLDQARVPPAVPNPEQASLEQILPNLLAGDFNADGILDLGGRVAYAPYAEGELPRLAAGPQRFFRSGMSFGGISNSILMALEPEIRTAAISVPGGGLTDIMTRMDLHAVIDRIYHELLGPVIVGEPAFSDGTGQGRTATWKVSFIRRGKKALLTGDLGSESLWSATLPVEVLEIRIPGDGFLRILNLDNGEELLVGNEDLREGECEGRSILQPGLEPGFSKGCFSRGIASDRGDRILITAYDGRGHPVDQLELQAPEKGMGKVRNTPDFRFFINLGQIALEPADPINYARYWFLEPRNLSGAGGQPAKNLLVANIPGDMFVPINSQAAVVRAGGLLGSDANVCDGRPRSLGECGENWAEISRDCDCINLYWKSKDVMIGNYLDCACLGAAGGAGPGEGCEDLPRYDLDGFGDGVSPACDPHPLPLIDNRGRGAGYSYVRFPYSHDCCSHGYLEPVNRGMHWLMAAFYNPGIATDWAAYYQNQMAEYYDTDAHAAESSPEVDCACPFTPETCRFLP